MSKREDIGEHIIGEYYWRTLLENIIGEHIGEHRLVMGWRVRGQRMYMLIRVECRV